MKHQKHYRRFLFLLAMLSAATFGMAQTANDYWLAADKALAAGDTDSTFYYLNLFREKFGRQYAYAYTTFLTEEDYRTTSMRLRIRGKFLIQGKRSWRTPTPQPSSDTTYS